MDLPSKKKSPYGELGPPPPGTMYSQMPADPSHSQDPFWYDSMGGNPMQQRDVFNASKTDEEQIQLVKDILKENPRDPEGFDRRYDVLYHAAEAGSEAVVKWLLTNSEAELGGPLDLNGSFAKGDDPRLALQAACYGGYLDVVKCFIEHATSLFEQRPILKSEGLSSAVFGGRLEVVRYLVEQGASPAGIQPNGNTTSSFDYAARIGSLEIFELLSKAISAQDPSPAPDQESRLTVCELMTDATLRYAAQSGSLEMVKRVLEAGHFIHGTTGQAEASRRSAVMWALPFAPKTDTGSIEVARVLLDALLLKGSNGQYVSSDEEDLGEVLESSVVNAASRGYADMLLLFATTLRDSCAATTWGSKAAYTKMLNTEALARCTNANGAECARVLVKELGADINAHDEANMHVTILDSAARKGNKDLVTALLELGADLHQGRSVYCNGPTPLWIVVREAKPHMVRFLLDRGGPVESKDQNVLGATHVRVEIERGHRAPVRLVRHDPEGPEDSRNYIVLDFDEGVTKEWLDNVQLRKSDEELASDGAGRNPLQSGEEFVDEMVFL